MTSGLYDEGDKNALRNTRESVRKGRWVVQKVTAELDIEVHDDLDAAVDDELLVLVKSVHFTLFHNPVGVV